MGQRPEPKAKQALGKVRSEARQGREAGGYPVPVRLTRAELTRARRESAVGQTAQRRAVGSKAQQAAGVSERGQQGTSELRRE